MPTEHKKSKAAAKVEIKVEAQDVHPLNHYIDDRVELIRQIFMSLKSKQIKSIAPDFLQGKSLETIQEYCLDELLGISNKRLRSIINATKCPDNTDSSDSDVENIEEHISLEEISSDSDDALHAKKTSKGKSKATAAASNKNGATGATGTGKKEVSVLELLELQARARAIRSQLALEPVTKIELDSDNDSADGTSTKIDKNSASTATTSDNNKTKSSTVVQEANGIQIIIPSVPAVKPVRLKRNFRQRQNDDYDPDDDDETKSVENCALKEPDKPLADDGKDGKDETTSDTVKVDETKRDEPERSPSPDLIPIVQEPETYCISSDSDEPGSSSVPKYITYPTVVREKLPETEDEKFLKKIKEGSGVDLRDLIKGRRGGNPAESGAENSETIDNDATTQSRTEIVNHRRALLADINVETSSEQIPVVESEKQLDKDTEPEEGELTDGDDPDELDVHQITISSDEENDEKSNKCEVVTPAVEGVSETIKDESSSESSATSDNDSDSDSSNAPIFKEADDDDDIIDLGKDEELDFEMKEVEQSGTKNKKLKKTKKKVKVPDKPNEAAFEAVEEVKITEEANAVEDVSQSIEITDSTEKDASEEVEPATVADPTESDTWQTRWLRGRNVTKVMATSRLANKVRTKIKQKKSKAATEPETLNADSGDKPPIEVVPEVDTPPVEEGSVQHYEVLVAQESEKKNE